jgi:hypothetical protein
MGQIVVDLAHLALAVYVVLVLWRLAATLLKDRWPAAAHGIEFAIGKD